MKEHPIIFNTETVKAILDGRKTQTRRVIKPQPLLEYKGLKMQFHRKCPYGQVGDRLWVRETWAVAPTLNTTKPSDLLKKYDIIPITYRATYPNESHYMWRPSIFMPRWASRITLEIIGVRVEQLQEITDEDALAEGVYGDETPYDQATPSMCFEALWDSLNAKRGYGWDKNPWVWVLEFKKVDK